jgi:type II secretory pathway component PulF
MWDMFPGSCCYADKREIIEFRGSEMSRVLLQVKEFFRRHLLLCAVLFLLASLAVACLAYRDCSQGRTFQALCLDLPFVVVALLAAFASVIEWRSHSEL